MIKGDLRGLGMVCLGIAALAGAVIAGSPVNASDAAADAVQREGAIFERQSIMDQLDKDGFSHALQTMSRCLSRAKEALIAGQ